MIEKIRKRDGRVVAFDRQKIAQAIYKATCALGHPDWKLADDLSKEVTEAIGAQEPSTTIVTIEEVQDTVEQVLAGRNLRRLAEVYHLYRQRRAEIRKEKERILRKRAEIDEVDKKFDLNALRVLRSRYLKKDENGRVVESPRELFQRVATHATLPSLFFDKGLRSPGPGRLEDKEGFDLQRLSGRIKLGKYPLNRFHLKALQRLYRRFRSQGKIGITFRELLKKIEAGCFHSYEKEIDNFYHLMVEKKFLPNTPALVNFGNHLGMGSACFVLAIDDSLESIMETLKKSALIFKAGGGVGYNFSCLRPEGDFVETTGGTSSGPISFMELFDKMTEVIKQGGIRRGASIGILDCDHPDIEKFISAKEERGRLRNFNISVRIKPEFWDYYRKKKPYPLVNPRTRKIAGWVDPERLLERIIYQAWKSGEPGIIFDDNVNRYNPFLKTLGPINSTNPCGEVLLYPNESCNLGSINIWAFVVKGEEKKEVSFDWDGLSETVRRAVLFLDNIVEVNEYPLPEIEAFALSTRKVGLGIMGLADLLFELQIPYNSKEGIIFMEKLMEFINFHSKLASLHLSVERGPFPYFEKSFYTEGRLPIAGAEEKKGERKSQDIPLRLQKVLPSKPLDWAKLSEMIRKEGLRNAYTTVIAPTGSLSMIAGTSSGIEPVFSLIFEKKVTVGSFYYLDPVFERTVSQKGLFSDILIKEVAKNQGSIKKITALPKRIRRVFVTAMDIKPADHIKALAALQKWVDSSISKTINIPFQTSPEELKKACLLAHKLGCKDISFFRDRSIPGVLRAGGWQEKTTEEEQLKTLIPLVDVKAGGRSIYREPESRYTPDDFGYCPVCGGGKSLKADGCRKCPHCGWGLCE